MGKIVLDKVLGKNLQDFADNIDKNFNRIESNGIWRGEKGESYVEKTIDLWREDTDGNIVIINEDILRVLFTEADGSASAWPLVKSWAENNKDQFISLQIPKTWSLYPGFPLYYTQPAECFKMFKSDTDDTGTDWSGMVAAVGSDEGSYVYKRYDILPRLYLDVVSGNYCWMINGVKTGVTASINPDQETRNIRLYLIRTAADGSIQYMVDKESGTGWYKNPDIYPRVGDFAWRLETKNITSGGETRDAQVLEVCMYDGNTWIAAAADDDNENFLLTYDDMVMQYIWKSIYGGLGDEYDGDMRAVDTKSFQLPAHDDDGNATTDSHKITSKSYSNGKRSDIFIENPYKGQNPEVKSNIVLSGYDNIYLNPPTIQSDGSVKYNDEWVIKKSELDSELDKIESILDDRLTNIENIKTVTIEELWDLDFDTVRNGEIIRVDRCYWKHEVDGSGNRYNLNALYGEAYDGNTNRYTILPFVRYVYLHVYVDDDNIYWDHKGVGLVYMEHDEYRDIMPFEVELLFPEYSSDNKWDSGVGNDYKYSQDIHIGRYTYSTGENNNDTYVYDCENDDGLLTIQNSSRVFKLSDVNYNKFGIISWMKDPEYGNECDWDFMMMKTFEMIVIESGASSSIIPYFDPFDPTLRDNKKLYYVGGARMRLRNNKLTSYHDRSYYVPRISIPSGDVTIGGQELRASIRIYQNSLQMDTMFPDTPIICDNIFSSCNIINIKLIMGSLSIGDTDTEDLLHRYISNNIFDSSIVQIISEEFGFNKIYNSKLNIGSKGSSYRHRLLDSSFGIPSNMIKCEVNNSTLSGGFVVQDVEYNETGGHYFITNDGKNSRLKGIYNIWKLISKHRLYFYNCKFHDVNTLDDIFVLRGYQGYGMDGSHKAYYTNDTYIKDVIYNGKLYEKHQQGQGDDGLANIPCYDDLTMSTQVFSASFIGIDISSTYANKVVKGVEGVYQEYKGGEVIFDKLVSASDYVTLRAYPNNLPSYLISSQESMMPHTKIVFIPDWSDVDDKVSSYNMVYMPIVYSFDYILYCNIPIYGYGYTKSLEDILKN